MLPRSHRRQIVTCVPQARQEWRRALSTWPPSRNPGRLTAAADFSERRRSCGTPSEPRRPTESHRWCDAGTAAGCGAQRPCSRCSAERRGQWSRLPLSRGSRPPPRGRPRPALSGAPRGAGVGGPAPRLRVPKSCARFSGPASLSAQRATHRFAAFSCRCSQAPTTRTRGGRRGRREAEPQERKRF